MQGNQETWVHFLGWEDPLEKEMATHSSVLAWKIPWTQETGGPQSMESQRFGHDWACVCTHAHAHTRTHTLFHNIHFLVPILLSGSSWHNFHHETILTHLTKVKIKDFKGKYRTDHLESKLKICYQRQLNNLRKLVLFTERKTKSKFCASLLLKSTYSMKFFLNWANQEAVKQ